MCSCHVIISTFVAIVGTMQKYSSQPAVAAEAIRALANLCAFLKSWLGGGFAEQLLSSRACEGKFLSLSVEFVGNLLFDACLLYSKMNTSIKQCAPSYYNIILCSDNV